MENKKGKHNLQSKPSTKKAGTQMMGPTCEERLKPSPPFYNSALDLFGPIMIKDTVKGRTRKKDKWNNNKLLSNQGIIY